MLRSVFSFVVLMLILSVSQLAFAQVSQTTVVATGILKMGNGTTSKMTIEMTGPNMAECWANAGHRACSTIYWKGSINGRPVGNFSNGGSTFTEHIFYPGQSPYLKMSDCGPYVGACEYSWIGRYNSVTHVYEGTISFYPATYGYLTVYKNKIK